MKKMRKFVSMLLTALTIMTALAIPTIAAEIQGAERFPDVKKTDWYYSTVDQLTKLGAISGMPDGKFYPNNTITRAEFITIVVASTPTTVANSNNDPYPGTNHWAKDAIIKAEMNNLLQSGEYAPDTWDKPILRQEMAQIVSRTMEFVLKEDIVIDTAPFTAKITDWDTTCTVCKPDIAQAYAKGIITGMPDGSFQGSKTATRAEAATMVVKLIDKDFRGEYYSGISFNAKANVNEKGIMKIDKAEEFCMYVVEHMEFYKENGKYYVKAEYPELPNGFETSMQIMSEFNNNQPVCYYMTRPIMPNDERKIPNTGSFTREIVGMTGVNSISKLEVKVSVIKAGETTRVSKDLQEGNLYFSTTYKNEVGVVYEDGMKRTKYIEYDFGKLFKW